MKFIFTLLCVFVMTRSFAQIDTLRFWNGDYMVVKNDTIVYPEIKESQKTTEFAGGQVEMGKFIGKTLRVPEEMRRRKENGKVLAIFTVDKSGMPTNIRINGDTTLGRGKEALRVVKAFPRWVPASQNGRIIQMRTAVSIEFRTETIRAKD